VVDRLVVQPLANRQVRDDLDAEVVKLPGRANSGPEQDGGAADGTRRQDDLPGLVDGPVGGLDADGGPAGEQDPDDLGPVADGQVGATAHVVGQVSDPRVLPDAVEHVDRNGRHPDALVRVRVVDVGVALLLGGIDERPDRRGELVVGPLVNRERPGPAVKPVVAALRGLECPESRQHLVPRPAGQAARGPLREVGRQCPQGDRRVDRRTAPEDLAPGRGDLPVERARPAGRRAQAPVVFLVAADPLGVEQDPRVLAALVCRAGLQQEHGTGRVLRQPGRQYGAG
jgi:hypothetical protein